MKVKSRFWWRTGVFLMLTPLLLLLLSSSAFAFVRRSEGLIQISSDPYTNSDTLHKTEVEPDSFAFGDTVVATFQVGRSLNGGASNIGWATSRDRGETWTSGFLPGITAVAGGSYADASDSSVVYDAKHKVWIISYLAIKQGGTSPPFHIDVLASRSTDGGLTWGKPVPVSTGGFHDKSWSVCDDTPKSHFFGNCYTEWNGSGNTNLFQMSASVDGGLTWEEPKGTADHASGTGGQPVVQPDGIVVVPALIAKRGVGLIVGSFRSIDGGATWSKSVEISSLTTFFEPALIRNPNLPSAQVDKNGRVYVVWQDCRFELVCNVNDIVMSTSTDGVTWSPVVRIPIDAVGSGVDHFTPAIGVDRSTGGDNAHIGLTYYYFTNANCATTTCQLSVGFVSSTNGGEDWSMSERLVGPMMLTWFAFSGAYMYGDYISTSIVPGSDDAMPVFAVAKPPTHAASCNLLTIVCHEAMYAASGDLVRIKGGPLPVMVEHIFLFSEQRIAILPTDY